MAIVYDDDYVKKLCKEMARTCDGCFFYNTKEQKCELAQKANVLIGIMKQEAHGNNEQ